MTNLEQLRQDWHSLIAQRKVQEAEILYWDHLFPLVEGQFLSTNTFAGVCDWLILPVGLEASYYILLIKMLKPQHVYFLGTQEFKQNFLNKIIEKSGLMPSAYMIDTVSYDRMDVVEVYNKIRSHLSLFIGKRVIMDLTRGKRILTVGSGIVGAFFGFDLVYIDEEWIDELKRGSPGTEKLVLVKNPFEVFGDLELKEARNFFDHYNYGAALALYKRIKQKVVDPRNVEIEELLSESYLHWNSFNFKAAITKMEQALAKSKQYDIKMPSEITKNLRALMILNSADAFYQLHIIVDLYANALRKSEVGLFEDAISRLYRVIELISQYKLSAHGIDTTNPILEKHESAYQELTKEIYGFAKKIPSEIGLKDGYLLLYILQDPLLQGYSLQELKQMFGIIRARDMSIIAHGLQLAGEKVFVNMNTLAKSFIKTLCHQQGKDFADLLSQHTFAKL